MWLQGVVVFGFFLAEVGHLFLDHARVDAVLQCTADTPTRRNQLELGRGFGRQHAFIGPVLLYSLRVGTTPGRNDVISGTYPGQSAIVPARLAGANLARQAGLVATREERIARYVHQFISSFWIHSPPPSTARKKAVLGVQSLTNADGGGLNDDIGP